MRTENFGKNPSLSPSSCSLKKGGRGISLWSRCFLTSLKINKNILFNLILIKYYN
nr:MAG TPA: hypothetical protein [Ackermannviridae sp.]